jgi:SAM-dependent methyltransferase
VRRKVALAVTMAEYFLRRPIENVLDVGCGEGAWFKHLRALRRNIRYSGMDASDYAVERFGRERNIRKGSFEDLRSVRNVFDLVVCSDVLHYVSEPELARGMPHLARVTAGLAYIEVLTTEDDIIGDLEGLIRRKAGWYRKAFGRAGFVQAGPYCWLPEPIQDTAAALELPR